MEPRYFEDWKVGDRFETTLEPFGVLHARVEPRS